MKGDQSYGNRTRHINKHHLQRLQKSLCHGPGGSTLVLQQGLPAPETVPGLQKEEKGGEGA